ncbi:UNVERIFIED_CONTAM: hypothetical protein RF653_09000 [Kocuria sp. CPCC 205316]|uniref:hypothetical protein n=1 Tax=Kocuria TaxID=57493 RepID=UPI0036DC2F57
MAGIESRIQDLPALRPDDQIEVWHDGHLHWVGTVEQVAPALEVAWIHEIPGGYRRLVHAQDADLRHHLPRNGAVVPQ